MGKEKPRSPDASQIELFKPKPGLFDKNRTRTPASEIDMTPEDLAEEATHIENQVYKENARLEAEAEEEKRRRAQRLAEIEERRTYGNDNIPAPSNPGNFFEGDSRGQSQDAA